MTGPRFAPSPNKPQGQLGPPSTGPPGLGPPTTPAMPVQNRFQPPPQALGGPNQMGAPNYGAPPPRPGMNMPMNMQQPPLSHAPPMGMGMVPRPPVPNAGGMVGPGPSGPFQMGQPPQGANSLPPKARMPLGHPPMAGTGPALVNGVPSSQPNYMGQPQQPMVVNGPPTGHTFPRPAMPPAMGMSQTSGQSPMPPNQGHPVQGQGPPLMGQFSVQRPPMGVRPPGTPQPGMPPLPPTSGQGPHQLLPGGRPPMTNTMQPGAPPMVGQQNSGRSACTQEVNEKDVFLLLHQTFYCLSLST